MSDEQRNKVVESLVNFIVRVANEKRPNETELRVLPEVINSLGNFAKF